MEKRYRLYVVGPTFGFNFLADTYGYETYTDSTIRPTTKPHLITFMGGTDIQPKLYGENPIAETESPDAYRDAKEIDLYKTYENLPKLGICRGAQLINVLNGGSLYQDVDGHEYGHHPIVDKFGKSVLSSSVHHQMMIPAPNAEVIAWSKPISNLRKTEKNVFKNTDPDPEILWIAEKRELLIQGHPEFGPDEFADYTFDLVDRLIWGKTTEKAA